MSLTTRLKVRQRGNIQAADGTYSTAHEKDTAIDLLISEVTDFVKGFTGRNFEGESVTEYTQAAGKCATAIVLAKYPVSSVTTVHVSESVPRAYGSDELLTEDSDYITDTSAGILHRVDGLYWPNDPQSIKAVYTVSFAGAAVPADVEGVAIAVILRKLDKGWSGGYSVTSRTLGDGSITGIVREDWQESELEVLRRKAA